MVNGTAIYAEDLAAKARMNKHNSALTVDAQKNLLPPIIRQELLAQRAEELGLDGDEEYQKGLRRLQVQLDAYRRTELPDLLYKHQLKSASTVTDAEAKAYYDANAERIRTELHVHQILRKGRAAIDEVRVALEKGQSFDDVVASTAMPGQARQPWDLGYLRWSQIPPAWQSVVYGLAAGEISPVIDGPNKRFWIIRLVDRRDSDAMTFEQEKGRITTILRQRKRAELADKMEAEMRARSQIKINYVAEKPR